MKRNTVSMVHRPHRLLALTLCIGLSAGSAAPADESVESAEAVETIEVDPQPMAAHTAAARLNALGVRLLDNALGENEAANVMLSPLSLASALTLTAGGAAGSTAAAFAEVLGYPDGATEAAGRDLQALDALLSSDDDSLTLSLANGIWLAPDLGLQPEFTRFAEANFRARVEAVDFADPATREAINHWFSERTREKIPELLQELRADTRIVIGNALYVNGRWQTAFDPELTDEAPFHVATDETRPVRMMHRNQGHILYREHATHQAVRLAFADPDHELLVVLPAEGLSTTALQAERDDSGQPLWLALEGFRPQPVQLALPRMDLELGGDLRSALEALGLGPAFAADADFGALASEPVMLDQVIHRVAFTVDEQGAEAAAATAITGVRSAPARAFEMIVDRPFLVALRHVPSEAILFLGRVGNPQP